MTLSYKKIVREYFVADSDFGLIEFQLRSKLPPLCAQISQDVEAFPSLCFCVNLQISITVTERWLLSLSKEVEGTEDESPR